MKLDLKDKRILYQLDLNSRQSFSGIGKKTGLGKEVVAYRIKRLMNDGVIWGFLTLIDVAKLGYYHAKIFCRLQKLTEKKEAEIISYLTANPNISWVATTDGRYDLAFAPRVKSNLQLSKMLAQIANRYGEYIAEKTIATILMKEYVPRSYFVGEGEAERDAMLEGEPQAAKIDTIDLKILGALAKNSRDSFVEIAKHTSITPEAVRARIKNLEKTKVIEGYTIWPNNEVLDQIQYKVLISLQSISESKEKKLTSFCRSFPRVVYFAKAMGQWDYEIDMEMQSVGEFKRTMRKINNTFASLIKDYSPLIISKLYKYQFLG